MGRRYVIIALLVVAVALIAAPFFVWPNYGETPFTLHVSSTDEPEQGDSIAYEDLSDAEKKAFDEARRDGSYGPLYSERDEEAVTTFQQYQYVEFEGQHYVISSSHADGAWMYVMVLRWMMFAGGALLAVVAGTRFVLDRRGG